MFTTKEGHIWTAQGGFRTGMASLGAINPPQHFTRGAGEVFDVIVIGSGYTGLVATRDLTTQGIAVTLSLT